MYITQTITIKSVLTPSYSVCLVRLTGEIGIYEHILYSGLYSVETPNILFKMVSRNKRAALLKSRYDIQGMFERYEKTYV